MAEIDAYYPIENHLLINFYMILGFLLFANMDWCFQFLYLKKKTKNFIYSCIKDKRLIQILDSFLSFNIVLEEIFVKKWEKIGFRLLVYIIALVFYRVSIIFITLFLFGMALSVIIHYHQSYKYAYKTKFNFQTLPFPIQKRFYELQTPLIRYRFPKVYFNKALISSYNQLYIDNLIVNTEIECTKLSESFNHSLNFYELNKKSNDDFKFIKEITYKCGSNPQKCQCPVEQFDKVSVVKSIWIHGFNVTIDPSINDINPINPKEAIITKCRLPKDSLKLLGQFEYIKLHLCDDGTEYLTKMSEMLEATKGSTIIDLAYSRKCENQEEFDKFLIHWIQENNYEKKYANIYLENRVAKKWVYEIV